MPTNFFPLHQKGTCATRCSHCFAAVFFDPLADEFFIGVPQRSFNGKSSSVRVYTPYYLLCLQLCHLHGKLFLIHRWWTLFHKKHNSHLWIIHENEPCSSAAKSMLPGNENCFMTSLANTKHSPKGGISYIPWCFAANFCLLFVVERAFEGEFQRPEFQDAAHPIKVSFNEPC